MLSTDEIVDILIKDAPLLKQSLKFARSLDITNVKLTDWEQQKNSRQIDLEEFFRLIVEDWKSRNGTIPELIEKLRSKEFALVADNLSLKYKEKLKHAPAPTFSLQKYTNFKKFLEENMHELCNAIKVDDTLLNILKNKKILTDEAKAVIAKKYGHYNKCEALLEIFKIQRTNADASVLLDALEQTGNQNAVEIFKNKLAL